MSSSRARLAALIAPMLPVTWRRRIETHTVRAMNTLAAPTVFIDHTAITHDGMPPGQLIDGFEVALVSHLTDYGKAEDAIDPVASAFVRAIDSSSEVAWSAANKRAIGDYLGWVITVQLLTPTKE